MASPAEKRLVSKLKEISSSYGIIYRQELIHIIQRDSMGKDLLNSGALSDKDKEVLLEAIFNQANIGICITDKDGIFRFLNRAYCNIYGYEKEELLGRHFTIVVQESQKEYASKMHDRFILEGLNEIPMEWSVVDKKGKILHIIATASRIEFLGEFYKMTTVDNITHIKELEEINKNQERILFQQSKMAVMGEMIWMISHQLKQPLNSISLQSLSLQSVCEDMGELGEEVIEGLECINKKVEFMDNTINNLRNFFKPSKKATVFDVKKAIQDLLEIAGEIYESSGIKIECDLAEGVSTIGYLNEFKNVILNIINNAKDAILSNPNPNSKRITIRLKEENGICQIEIEDSGGGVDEGIAERIFEPYFTTKEESGSGIGLYLAKSIISDNMNGEITFENSKEGALFRIALFGSQKSSELQSIISIIQSSTQSLEDNDPLLAHEQLEITWLRRKKGGKDDNANNLIRGCINGCTTLILKDKGRMEASKKTAATYKKYRHLIGSIEEVLKRDFAALIESIDMRLKDMI